MVAAKILDCTIDTGKRVRTNQNITVTFVQNKIGLPTGAIVTEDQILDNIKIIHSYVVRTKNTRVVILWQR